LARNAKRLSGKTLERYYLRIQLVMVVVGLDTGVPLGELNIHYNAQICMT